MKKILTVLACLLVSACVFAQQSLVEPDPEMLGVDAARQALREVSLDLFEREAAWDVTMPIDDGIISARLFDGSPLAKEPLPAGVPEGQTDNKVLGIRVDFMHRGHESFFIKPVRPIPIEGVTKTVSLWVCGRNVNHKLTLLVQDFYGSSFELYVGSLNFSGWKKLTVAIPPSPDGVHGIVQANARYGDHPGLRICGFRVDTDPLEAYGSYYMYIDDLRAVTDLYAMENRDKDEMSDNW